jgi:sirohydrochlorin ferrochelatase
MLWGVAALFAVASLSHAGPATAGTTAKASEVNGNFSAVRTAVNDNASRITTLESAVTPAGNIVLVPFTASAGNILKGTTRFIHDFGTSI